MGTFFSQKTEDAFSQLACGQSKWGLSEKIAIDIWLNHKEVFWVKVDQNPIWSFKNSVNPVPMFAKTVETFQKTFLFKNLNWI